MAGSRSKARVASTRKAKGKATTHPYNRNAFSTKKSFKSTEVVASETSASTVVPASDAFASTVISASSSLSVSGFILQEPELRARPLTSNLQRHETAKLRCKGEITCYTDMVSQSRRVFTSKSYTDSDSHSSHMASDLAQSIWCFAPSLLSSCLQTRIPGIIRSTKISHLRFLTEFEWMRVADIAPYLELIAAVLQSGTATRAARGDKYVDSQSTCHPFQSLTSNSASHARLVLWKIWFHSRLRCMKHGQ